MKLSMRGEALADLENIYDYISQDSPQAARSVTDRVWHTIQKTIKPFPMLGRAGRDERTREFPVRGLPYIVVYEIETKRDPITILSIAHGARERRY